MNPIMSKSNDSRVRLLTYNLFMRPPGIKNHEDDFKNERLHQMKEHIQDFDILCFQELFETGNFRKEHIIDYGIQNRMRYCYLEFYYWAISDPPSLLSGVPVDGGLAILSRFPILYSKFESYGVGILADCASDKGSLHCKILANNSVLNIFNTHLQATYHNQIDNQLKVLTIMTRLYQFEKLAERVDRLLKLQQANDHELVLITGDLNTDGRKTYFDLDFSKHAAFFGKYNLEIKEFNEYTVMIEILKNHGRNKVRDLAYEKYEGHPVTFGDGEKVFTKAEDVFSAQRLDYILQVELADAQHSIKPKTESCQVEKFNVNSPLYTHLSDHYGLSIELHSQK